MNFSKERAKDYSINGLTDHFNNKQKEIYAVKAYLKQIGPKNKDVDIEFDNDRVIERLDIILRDSAMGYIAPEFDGSDISDNSKKMDSILLLLGWTQDQLKTLKSKLDDADCISIASGEPAKIGYGRGFLSMYFFNVFDKPIPDSLKSRYNDSCKYIYANSKLVLEYGGGAVGSQCFFNKKK